LSNDAYESYRIFQGRVIYEYDRMVDEYGLIQMDGTNLIHEQQIKFRKCVKSVLKQKGIKIAEIK